ncbi:MAG: sulfate ABC transporter ATP-binding protein [Gammaproteobacteria bacterium]|nr:sulfate ABC transporter ATP-binding protein [Gammaproteobacteria bacterium]
MSIIIENVNKHFGGFHALQDVDLNIPTGELVALLGPSGCGKTSLLRIIAGLERPDTGSIRFNGEDATRQHVRERGVGFVFQHYALFHHMTVFDNVAFGLTVRPKAERPGKEEIREKVRELLRLVQLEFVADRYPNQLSGGQRQRIALARALAVEPKVLLLDEPFGALDANVRKELRRWLRRLHDEIHVTSVFVTHDQEEAMEVSSQIVVMNKGRIEQVGAPDEVYERPATAFVSRFLGSVNLFHGRVHSGWAHIGDLKAPAPEGAGLVSGAAAVVHLRPHEIDLATEPAGSIGVARVSSILTVGPMIRIELEREGEGREDGPVEVELTRERYLQAPLALGDRVFIRPRNLRVFAGT